MPISRTPDRVDAGQMPPRPRTQRPEPAPEPEVLPVPVPEVVPEPEVPEPKVPEVVPAEGVDIVPEVGKTGPAKRGRPARKES